MQQKKFLFSFILIISTISCAALRIRSPVYFLKYADRAVKNYEEGATSLEAAIQCLNNLHSNQIKTWQEKAEDLKKSRKRNMNLFFALSCLNVGIGLSIPPKFTSKDYDDMAGIYLGMSGWILSTVKPSIRADKLVEFYLELTKETNKRNAEWMELYEITEENLKKKNNKYKEDEEAYTAIAKKYNIPVTQK